MEANWRRLLEQQARAWSKSTRFSNVPRGYPKRIMSIFAKPVSQLEPNDLQQLVLGNAVENIRLEFKSRVPDKDETLKKISSFANSFGGFLVIGAAANSDN